MYDNFEGVVVCIESAAILRSEYVSTVRRLKSGRLERTMDDDDEWRIENSLSQAYNQLNYEPLWTFPALARLRNRVNHPLAANHYPIRSSGGRRPE